MNIKELYNYAVQETRQIKLNNEQELEINIRNVKESETIQKEWISISFMDKKNECGCSSPCETAKEVDDAIKHIINNYDVKRTYIQLSLF